MFTFAVSRRLVQFPDNLDEDGEESCKTQNYLCNRSEGCHGVWMKNCSANATKHEHAERMIVIEAQRWTACFLKQQDHLPQR